MIIESLKLIFKLAVFLFILAIPLSLRAKNQLSLSKDPIIVNIEDNLSRILSFNKKAQKS